MRAELSTIQQTLTPEAASVLNQSIAEAARRNHGQTTPLHVAATLLASPSGFLRQACIRSHPNSSHPLQCRALELCFSVALDRLPSAQNLSSSLEPTISNALMAALKRAQAHQRRGCPEQQQQPLLAVKVELEQLIVSILDDPSVSRVMREASFSSPDVKLTIEQSLNSSNSVNSSATFGSCGLGSRQAQSGNRNLYLNPRLQQGNSDQSGKQRGEEVKKVMDILSRSKKRNPVLVGESEPELVVKELLQKIEKRAVVEGLLRNVQVISLEKEFGSDRTQNPIKFKDLGSLIDSRISNNGSGVILNLGDLRWLVGFGGSGSGQAPQQIVSETGRVAVAEMKKLLVRFGEGSRKMWLIGTATCETYLRCQVYHPSMENDWDLQAVPIAARAPLPGLFPRFGGNGILSNSIESLTTPLKGFPTISTALSRRPSENLDPTRTKCCSLCMGSYEQELAKLVAELEKSPSDSKPESTKQPLPQWLQIAKPNNSNFKMTDQSQTKDQELIRKRKTEELQNKWNDKCLHLHPSFHHNLSSKKIASAVLPMTSLYNSNPLGRQALQPKLHLSRNLGGSMHMNTNQVPNPPSECLIIPPGSPVRTELVLGHPKIVKNYPEQRKQHISDLRGSVPSEPWDKFSESKGEKLASTLDPDSFKSLFKVLMEKVWWQNEAASAVAASVVLCRSGKGKSKRQCFGSKGDTWLLFTGPDRVGKKKMAVALSELVCRENPITIHLGSRCNGDEESDVNFRGQTTLDRIAAAVQKNPSSVVVLEDIDQADMLVHGRIKRAIERGRLTDSHGREVSLRNVIFILTTNWLPDNLKSLPNWLPLHEEKLFNIASKGWQLQLSVSEKSGKRRPAWLQEETRSTKSRTESVPTLSFDLNQSAEFEDDTAEGSRNSSDLTFEHDHEQDLVNKQSPVTPVSRELLNCVDETVVFKSVDFGSLQSKVASTISSKLSTIIDGLSIEVEDEAINQIVGGIWFGQTELEEWVERVMVPSFHRLKSTLPAHPTAGKDTTIVRLVSVRESERRNSGDWLPSKITVLADGCEL